MIDPQMEKLVDYLVEREAKIAAAVTEGGERPWVDFKDIVEAGKFEYDKIHEIFNRNRSNDEYAVLRQDGKASNKDLATAKLSGDWLGSRELCQRARTRSRVRNIVHGMNRHAADGTDEGSLRRNTIQWLGRILGESKA
jgi:hypothetical protein